MRTHHLLPLITFCATACTVGEDEAVDATAGVSVTTIDRSLSGCHGQASSTIPGDGRYVITTFGGPGDHQSMSCGGFADGTTFYAASRQRYGCGAKLRIEANGKCAVVAALDYGPDVCVERAAGLPVIDASPLVSKHLFGESELGWSDHVVVTVTEVDKSTALGICQPGGGGGPGDPPPPPTGLTCNSATLDRDVDEGTCVQAASDAHWYQCQGGMWVGRSSSAGCATAFGFCSSATLGTDVPPRTCVQAASTSTWFQCNGQGWVKPVDVAGETGPIGACSTMNPL